MSKSWVQSTTVWGLVVIAVGALLNKFGLPVDLATPITEALGNGFEVVGLVVAAYGRSKADTPLGGVLPSK